MLRQPLSRALACTSLAGLSASASALGVVATQSPTRPKLKAATKSAGSARAGAAGRRSGPQVYAQTCAPCHGARGEGGRGYKSPLTGEMSPGELSRFIAQEMPPQPSARLNPGEAQSVADFIHGSFYSPVAQARNRPARVELSRLTVRQLRNALTDLVASFGPAFEIGKERGLKAKYFKEARRDKPVLERVDATVDFHLGTSGALPEQDDPYQFAIEWRGSVVAPETGEYEFVARSEQAVELWVNDMDERLIDARVQSGSNPEHRASLWLQAGRAYPLRLTFFKGVQGVDDLKKLKEKPPQSASIQLAWKRPHRVDEPIPTAFLLPASGPRLFVARSAFAPDDRSMGYERGASVSKDWSDSTTAAALEVAAFVSANVRQMSGIPDDAPDRDARLRRFARLFVERAFRRPLSDEQTAFFVERQFQAAPSAEIALKRVVLLALKSPRFLFREVIASREAAPRFPDEPQQPAKPEQASEKAPPASVSSRPGLQVLAGDAYDVASRLSFALWDSSPDEELAKAAREGRLTTRDQVRAQAARMMDDPRARAKALDFFLQWLKVDAFPDLAKDAQSYPGFDADVASDLRTSLEMALGRVLWSEKSDLRELLLSDEIFLNGRLARIYGEDLPPDAPFQPVRMDAGQRSGVLTHPYLLSSLAYIDGSSPIHRGVLIARSVLGRRLMPPPQAFVPIQSKLHPGLSTRQRVALQTKPAACASCHSLINPLGFSLEKYDAIGRLRAKDGDAPIDASGSYRARDGRLVKFAGAGELAKYLAGSDEVHAAFVEKLFHHIVKQPVLAYGADAPAALLKQFRDSGFNMRRQMIEVAVLSSIE